jgi:hypothetical protein
MIELVDFILELMDFILDMTERRFGGAFLLNAARMLEANHQLKPSIQSRT